MYETWHRRSPFRRMGNICWLGLSVLWLMGCSGNQSTVDPARREADRIAIIVWCMVVGAAVIWLSVNWLSVISLALYYASLATPALPVP